MQTWGSNNAQGLDASHWQGYIDWTNVRKSGKSFAWLKFTQGSGYRDSYFSANLAGARNNSILVGAYHFLEAGNETDAASEADFFLKQYGNLDLDLPIVLDVEEHGCTAEAALVWLQKVEKALGERPLVYTYPSFIDTDIGSKLKAYGLWYAFYNLAGTVPKDKGGWTSWEFMQYTSSGAVPGMSGNIDLNVYKGTEAELRAAYGKAKLAAWVADTIISTWVSPSWADAKGNSKQQEYIHWLADEMRRAAGMLPKYAGWVFTEATMDVIRKTWLSPAWEKANASGDTKNKNNVAWLADQLRIAAGVKPQSNTQWMS